MQLRCPKCGTWIPPDAVNVVSDLAKCGESEAFFIIPRPFIKGGHLFMLGFSTFWLGFVAFWTWGAVHASSLFALFSLPFWIVGFAMGAGVLNALLRRETIEVKADELVVRRQQPLVPTVVTIPCADIRPISVEPVAPRSPMEAASLVAGSVRSISRSAEHPQVFGVPTISHGTRRTRFAPGVSEAEMKWMVASLRAIVGAKTGRRS